MTIPSWAKPGAKVACIDASEREDTDPGAEVHLDHLVLGQTYTLRDIAIGNGGKPGVRLAELGATPFGFLLARFRPAVEPKTEAEDVALFRHHLKQPEGVERE